MRNTAAVALIWLALVLSASVLVACSTPSEMFEAPLSIPPARVIPKQVPAPVKPTELLWRFDLGGGPMRPAPVTANGVVYFGSRDQFVYAVDAETGKLRWRFRAEQEILSSPTVSNGVLFVVSAKSSGPGKGSDVYALDIERGELLWRYRLGAIVRSSPVVMNGDIYFSTNLGRVIALDAASGSLRLEFITDGRRISSSAVADGLVYVGTGDSYESISDRVFAFDAATGKLRWKVIANGSSVRFTVADNGIVFATSEGGYVLALDAESGDILWDSRLPGRVYGPPTAANGVIYFGLTRGQVYALNASTGEVLWDFEMSDGLNSSPVLVDGIVYVGSTDGRVHALDAETGVTLRHYVSAEGTEPYPTVSDGVLFAASRDGYVRAIDLESGELRWDYRTGNITGSRPSEHDSVIHVRLGSGHLCALSGATGVMSWCFQTGHDDDRFPYVVGSGGIYVHLFDRHLGALDAETGELKWRFEIGESLDSFPSAPDDDAIYVGSEDGHVYALETETGAVLWRYQVEGTVIPIAVDDGVVYASANDPESVYSTLYAISAANGNLLWRSQLKLPVYSVRLAPAAAPGVLYAVSDYGVAAFDIARGRLLWKVTEIYPNLTLSYGVAFVGARYGHVYALNAVTGKQLWHYHRETYSLAMGKKLASPLVSNQDPPEHFYVRAVADGIVHVYSWYGYVFALEAATGEALWRREGFGPHSARGHVLANDVLYVPAGGSIYALNAVTGNVYWAFNTGANGVGRFQALENRILFFSATYGAYSPAVLAISISEARD